MTMPTRREWTDADREAEIRKVARGLGRFPSNQELLDMGRGDLSNQISKHGGFLYWSGRVGIARRHSDSDTGWAGEDAFVAACDAQGITAARVDGVKAPFDVLAEAVLRVDVKAAKYAEYGACRGWFYRIGKMPQADVVVLWQLDTGDFYGLPWTECPRTNVTVSRDGGKYAAYRNNWPLIRQLIAARTEERRSLTESAA